MTGTELRAKLVLINAQVTELAKNIGTSHQSLSQALNSKDVKTGLVEKIASALNLPLSYFYGEGDGEPRAIGTNINGSHSPNVSQTLGCDSALTAENKLLREQNEFLQNQVKTLLSIISKDK